VLGSPQTCLSQSAEVEAATGGGHPNKEGPSWGAGERSTGALSWSPGKRIPLPREIVAQLDEHVVGQDDAKRVGTPSSLLLGIVTSLLCHASSMA